MGDSISKHNENSSDELEQLRDKFAGQLWVRCASGDHVDFDFSNVERKHITYGLNGKDIRAKAKVVGSVESKICYLKFCNNYAKIIKFAEDKIKTVFSDLKNAEHIVVHKDKTIAKVDNPVWEKINPEFIRNYDITKYNPHPLTLPKEIDNIEDYCEEAGIEYPSKRIEESPFNNKSFHFTSLPWHLLEDPNLISEEDKFQIFVRDYCNKLADLLIEKNKAYGNSALDPVRVFSTSDSEEQLRVRIDDKLSRIKRGNNSFNEDTVQDIQGYLVLLQYKKSQE